MDEKLGVGTYFGWSQSLVPALEEFEPENLSSVIEALVLTSFHISNIGFFFVCRRTWYCLKVNN